MRAGLFSVPTSREFDAQGYLLGDEGQVVPGYVFVRTLPADAQLPERHLVLSEPGAPILPDAYQPVAADGQTEWDIPLMRAVYPGLADLVLQAEYRLPGDTDTDPVRRCWMADLPAGAVVLATDLPPVVWAEGTPDGGGL